MRAMPVLTAAFAAVALATPQPAFADGRSPGSVLIYPVHRSGANYFTVVCVTNTSTQNDGDTLIHYQYANVNATSDPFRPSSCTIFNRTELLTPADTLCVLTSCHNAVDPQGQEGYLVVSAQDPEHFNVPWSFNWLVGSELVINGSGLMYATNAIPFEARVPARMPTDLDSDNNLDFDDLEYEATPDFLYIDSFVAIQGSQLALLNLTGTSQDINTVQFAIWNDNEYPLSTTMMFNCWFDRPLQDISTVFTQNFLRFSTPHDPAELNIDCSVPDNTVETGWAIIDSINVSTPGGFPVADDGALLGAITCGHPTRWDGGHLLWESVERQTNGEAFGP
ncbi:MAG: hypothetical protein GY711_33530 [bacterium]|nr:hypothetical protein [bacterium]